MLVPLHREDVVLTTERERDLRSYWVGPTENLLGLRHNLARNRTTQHAVTRRGRVVHADRRYGLGARRWYRLAVWRSLKPRGFASGTIVIQLSVDVVCMWVWSSVGTILRSLNVSIP